jgi:hypothetical protein
VSNVSRIEYRPMVVSESGDTVVDNENYKKKGKKFTYLGVTYSERFDSNEDVNISVLLLVTKLSL